ncbi:hypothetical protein ZIOFF_069449 [Zingiber officinale]|uniref:Transmembrane protein n=1 Tax=Zingiber officinale TaxID=94328 RepID=A0A8J5EV46_ZINOF|nr:hypothetical protein ZIOFF_069449 [Zingiber officinale]
MEKGALTESKQSSSSSNRRTKLFNFLAFLLLTFTTAESTYRSRHQPSALAFTLFSYADLVLLFHCLTVFERLGPDATLRKKEGLKALVWLLATAQILAFTWRVAAEIPLPIAFTLWLMAGLITISGFYLMFFRSEADVVDKSCLNCRALVKQELSPDEKGKDESSQEEVSSEEESSNEEESSDESSSSDDDEWPDGNPSFICRLLPPGFQRGSSPFLVLSGRLNLLLFLDLSSSSLIAQFVSPAASPHQSARVLTTPLSSSVLPWVRQKRRAGEGTSRQSAPVPSGDRFRTEAARQQFAATDFAMIPCRYLNQTYFTTIVPDVMEIIEYFGLDKLVHCTHLVNLDLCKEFYINLHPRGSGGHTWVSRVGCVDIEFTPSILQSFLECRASESSFTCFPTVVEPFTDSLSHLSIEVIHQYYFNAPRAPLRRIFNATRMSARSNILYKVVIGCILPIVTRGQAKIRLPHLVMMYALEHRLDINIALHVFESIVHFSSPSNEKLYMPYCHILTSFFASRGLDVMRGQLHQLSKDYDQIGARQMSLAGIERRQGEMVWRAQEADDSDAEEADVPPPALAPHPVPVTIEARLTQLEETVRQGFQEFRGFRQDWTASQQRQADMYAMLQRWDLTYQAPPPPPSDDH